MASREFVKYGVQWSSQQKVLKVINTLFLTIINKRPILKRRMLSTRNTTPESGGITRERRLTKGGVGTDHSSPGVHVEQGVLPSLPCS